MPGIEKQRYIDKEDSKKRRKILKRTRGNPFRSGAQQHWTDWPRDAPLRDRNGEEAPPLPEESKKQGGMLDLV